MDEPWWKSAVVYQVYPRSFADSDGDGPGGEPHTSDEHPWFEESRSSNDNAKRHWYWWRPARPGTTPGELGAEPNNWGSFFSGSAWEYDDAMQEYYLHLFSKKQPDLNWENPAVREHVYDMMRWWLDRGVDGFRMDVINFIAKLPGLPDHVVDPGALCSDGTPYEFSRPHLHDFLREKNEEVFEFEHMGVDRGGDKWDVLPFALPLLKSSLGRWQRGLAECGWNSLYWNNHDQPRVVSRFGDDGEFRVRSAKLLGTVLHMHRGTPYSRSFGSWRVTTRAHRCSGTKPPTRASPRATDEDSVLRHYQKLIRLRHDEPVVAHGDFTMLLDDHPHLYAFTRRLDDTELLVLGNFSTAQQAIDVPNVASWLASELLLGNVPHELRENSSMHLAPWESRIYKHLL